MKLKKHGKFSIETFDKYGNVRKNGGDKIEIEFTKNDNGTITKFSGEVKDLKNGSYDISYFPESAGEFQCTIKINGEEFDKKPILKVKQTNLKEINEEELEKIHDHDLLESLINAFKEEEFDSLLTEIQELREQLIAQIRSNLDVEKQVKENEKKIELLINNRIEADAIIKRKTK